MKHRAGVDEFRPRRFQAFCTCGWLSQQIRLSRPAAVEDAYHHEQAVKLRPIYIQPPTEVQP